MDELKIQRARLRAQLARFKVFLTVTFQVGQEQQLQARLEQIELIYMQFTNVQNSIETLAQGTEELAEQPAEWAAFENEYFELVGNARNILHPPRSQMSVPVPVGNTLEPSKLKLPPLKLETFSGSQEEWLGFSDYFLSVIHKNENLTPVEKMYYLRASLKDEALRVIDSLELSEANYSVAWELLKDTYCNKALIIQNHVKALFDMKSLKIESHKNLLDLRNSILQHTRALKSLGEPVQQWDAMLIHLVLTKLDPVSLKEWQRELKINVLPTFSQLEEFITRRCHILATSSCMEAGTSSNTSSKQSFSSKNTLLSTSLRNCPKCQSEDHKVELCPKFLALSISERINEVRRLRLCYNCLKPHKTRCRIPNSCTKCSGRHNTILHLEREASTPSKPATTTCTTLDTTLTSCLGTVPKVQSTHVYLATVLVNIQNKHGALVRCRAMLDSGSQVSFITESLCQRLGLKRHKPTATIRALGNSKTDVKHVVSGMIQARTGDFVRNTMFYVLPKITDCQPNFQIDEKNLVIPTGLELADPGFNQQSRIDMLLGGDVFWDAILQGKVNQQGLTLQETVFGWVICGASVEINQGNSSSAMIATVDDPLDETLRKFWEFENIQTVSSANSLSQDDLECERIYDETTSRDSTGRYIVSLPLKTSPLALQDSRLMALGRFLTLERTLSKNSQLYDGYRAFMNEYLTLGHMELVGEFHDESINVRPSYYIPHHCVIRESSSTTKLRVVFDASALTANGPSLNDLCLIGPVVQNSLFTLIMRFRRHRYAFSADIEKMYRQFLINRENTDLQRILWRNSASEKLKVYRLLTVTYGTAPAPYLATKTLQRLARDYAEQYPEASQSLENDFYVDDYISGHDSLELAIQLQKDMTELLKLGGMNLRKWTANHPDLLAHFPPEYIETATAFTKFDDGSPDPTVKVLGLQWNPRLDTFVYNIPTLEIPKEFTKRQAYSLIGKLFDPLGFVAPAVVAAKMQMQNVWKMKCEWGELLPSEMNQKLNNFFESLTELKNISISRWVAMQNTQIIELHGFCDASERAYGACMYMKCYEKNGNFKISLLSSKSKVAPLKNLQTLARLELCGALMLSQLTQAIQKSIGMHIDKTILYTDSMIVLAWLKADAHRFNSFVANRISKIQELTLGCTWKHVKSSENPADLVSRGCIAKKLIDNELWWRGPEFMQHATVECNEEIELENVELIDCKKNHAACHLVSSDTIIQLVNKNSVFPKLRRKIAYCLRFISHVKKFLSLKAISPTLTLKGYINLLKPAVGGEPFEVDELKRSEVSLIRISQQVAFPKEFKHLQKQQIIPKGSDLVDLNPFVDEQGLIRVGGRLKNSSLSYDTQHPIILPRDHLAQLIVKHLHLINEHCGTQTLLNEIRQKYWPLRGRNLCKFVTKQCFECRTVNPRPSTQLMGQLPRDRVNVSRPFQFTGVDYCGPILVRHSQRKGVKPTKAYIAIFVCFTTKAIHVELVTDLTTQSFLSALQRFIARRGKPAKMFSDNAKTFVGAKGELKQLETSIKAIKTYCGELSIKWEFIPPGSPHFGGLWEIMVRQLKNHLKRVVGKATLTYMEMNTVLTRIEAVINSRPITSVTDDPTDLSPLTPAHFLVGTALTSLPPVVAEQKITLRARWIGQQALLEHFWARWSKEYLTSLQTRSKWRNKTANLRVGELVMVHDLNSPPFYWRLGRITKIIPGEDGLVRVVEVKTFAGTIRRTLSQISPLEESGGQDV